VTRKLRLAVTLTLLTWVACRTDWTAVAQAFAGLRLELWLAALATLIASQFVSSWRWQILARPFGFERTVPQLAGYYFIGMYFNLLLPTSVGGDVVRAWYLDGGSGRRLPALIAVFLDRLSGLLVLLSLACAGVLLSPLALPAWIPGLVWSATGCTALGLAAAPWLARRGQQSSGLLRKVGVALDTLRSPRLLAGSTLLSLGVQLGNVLLVWLIGEAMGAPVPGAYYWILVPMATLLTMLPVSINGMGVREGAAVLLLAPLGVAEDTAVTLALLWFAVFLAASLLGGLVYWWGQFPRPVARAATPGQGEAEHGPVGCSADQGRTRQHQAAA
jgi:uncharacterized membrane protein YbhN (UPF0104 family)